MAEKLMKVGKRKDEAQWSQVVGTTPEYDRIESRVYAISAFGDAHGLSPDESYAYLRKYQGLDYLTKYLDGCSCLPMEALVADLTKVCRNHGGNLK